MLKIEIIGCFKPGAMRPVSTATIKAQMCFCLSPARGGKIHGTRSSGGR